MEDYDELDNLYRGMYRKCDSVYLRDHDSIVQMNMPVWWIHDYPKDIQEKYFETHDRIPSQPVSAPALIKKGLALLVCLGLLAALMLLAGARDFLSAFLASYGLWLIVDWYDCFFLDWVLFANLKRVRLPGTEQMDEAYHQKTYHFVHSAIGMALGIVPCLLCGWIIMLMEQ